MVFAILRKEMIGSGRHGRYFLVRGVYLLLLAALTIPTIASSASRISQNPWAASSVGKDFTIAFGILQFALVVLLAPAFAIGAIAGERDTGGLDLLHAAGIGPVRIVTGKYAAKMGLLVLFVASGLPLFFAGTLLGGVGAQSILLLTASCVIAAALGTGLGFTLSGGMRQTVPALVLAYLLLLAVYAGIPTGLLFWSEALAVSHVSDKTFAWTNPIIAVVQYADGSLPAATAWLALLPHAVLAGIALLPSLGFAGPDRDRGRRFRAPAVESVGRAGMITPPPPRSVPWRPKIRGNPVAWRDARAARRGLASRILRISYLGLGSIVFFGTITATIVKGMRGRPLTLWNVFQALSGDSMMRDLSRISLFLLVAGFGLIALVVSSGSIAEERDRKALPLLRLSRLGTAEIVGGKLWGLAAFLWPIATLPVLLTLVVFEFRQPSAIVLVMVLLAGVASIAVGTGLFFSAWAKRPATAVGIALGVALIWCIVPPIITEFLRMGSDARTLVTFVNPMMGTIEIIDRFGKEFSSYSFRNDEFIAAIAGLILETFVGFTLSLFAWTVLEAKEEPG